MEDKDLKALGKKELYKRLSYLKVEQFKDFIPAREVRINRLKKILDNWTTREEIN